jgi:hypothetical protein
MTSTKTIVAIALALATVASSLAVTAGALGSPRSASGPVIPAISPLSVTLSPNPAGIDAGQSVTLTTSVSGGTTPYTGYAWYAGTFSSCSGDSKIPAATGATYTVAVPTSDEYICASVNDSETPSVTAFSATDLVTVNTALTVGPVAPASATIDAGQSLLLTAGATGGSGALTYQWYSGAYPSACTLNAISGATSASLTVDPTVTTNYCYIVGDHSVGTPAQGGTSGPATVKVDSALVASAPTPSGLYGDSGQSFTLKANASGGTLPYTYQWYSSGASSCSSGQTALGTGSSQVVNPTASTYYCYSLTDNSTNAPTKVSPATEVAVNATLTAGPISPASPAIDSGTGESVVLIASPSGGALAPPARGYAYQWYSGTFPACSGDTHAIPSATAARYTASPTTSTYYCYEVTDANGTQAYSSTVLLTVNSPLVPGTPSPASSVLDAGRSVGLLAAPTGGTPPYSYQWFQGSSCSSGSLIPTATAATLTVTAAGSYVVRVTDSSNGTLALGQRSSCSSAASVTGSTDPAPTLPTVSATAIDSGESVTLTGSATGGTPVLTYQWLSGPASAPASKNCSNDAAIALATSASYTVAPSVSTYFCYVVSDGSVNPPEDYSPTVLVTVNGAPVAGAITSAAPAYVDLNAGETVTLLSHATPGTGTLTYQWYSGTSAICSSDTSPVGTNSATFTTPPSLSSSIDYCYAVTDAASPPVRAETSSAFLVTVNAALVAGVATTTATSLDVGQTVTLTANPTGGTTPYAFFQWFTGNASCGDLSLLAGATSSPVTIAPSGAGTTNFCYRVTDSSSGTPVQQSVYSASPVTVTVYSALSAGPVTCYDVTTGAACTSTVHGGDHVTLSANPLGGNSAGYLFQWYSGTSSVCSTDTTKITGQVNSTLPVVAAASPGTYYCYTVSDGAHGESAASATFFLDPSSSGPASADSSVALALATDALARGD